MPDTKRFGIAGEFLPSAFSLTSSLPRHRANFSLFYDGPADSWLQGFDIGAVVHWIAQYEDDNISLVGGKPQTPRTDPATGLEGKKARKVREWITLDLIASYTFNLPPPAPAEVPGFAKDGGKNVRMKDGKEKNVMPVSTAEYNPCGWRAWLNNVTFTVGMDNVTDEQPPFVAAAFENGYDQQTANNKGRLWYVGVKKRFYALRKSLTIQRPGPCMEPGRLSLRMGNCRVTSAVICRAGPIMPSRSQFRNLFGS